MTLHLLAYAPRGQEFEIADAVNAMGAIAIVPRMVELIRLPKQRRPQISESPFLPNYIFCALTPDEWHAAPKELATVRFIGPQNWRRVQAFAQQVESDYQHRMAQIEAGNRLSEYNHGDVLEILGGVMQGQLATFRRLIEGKVPMIEAEVQMQLLGRPVIATVDPINARKVAAE